MPGVCTPGYRKSMTTTTATAKLRFIPEDGKPVTVVVNGTEVSAKWTNGAGWTVMARRDGLTIHANTQPVEHIAVALFNQLVEQYEAETTAPADASTVKLTAPKGGATKMSPAEVIVIGQALDSTGRIRRGRGVASASIDMLIAMARRGFITLTGPQFRPTGGEVTDWGKRIHKETVAAAEATQQQQDQITLVLAYTAA